MPQVKVEAGFKYFSMCTYEMAGLTALMYTLGGGSRDQPIIFNEEDIITVLDRSGKSQMTPLYRIMFAYMALSSVCTIAKAPLAIS
jgi:hypothetical protein